MTSGKQRQLAPYLTEEEKAELAEIKKMSDQNYRTLLGKVNPVNLKKYGQDMDILNNRYSEIYTAADRRRKIEKLT